MRSGGPAPEVRVVPAAVADREIVRQLLEFNLYEFARFFDDAVLDEHGRFGYRWLDAYWTDPDRHPFLIRVDGRIGGLALVSGSKPRAISEFLVMPQYRRAGVGLSAARTVFPLFPGPWSVHQIPHNDSAVAFWRRAIPVPFTESIDPHGTTQRFVIP